MIQRILGLNSRNPNCHFQGTWMVIFETYLSPLLGFIMKNPLEGAQTALMLRLARLRTIV